MEKIENKVSQNKARYIELIKRITREGADIEKLLDKLERSDFYVAPASTKYHLPQEGGLCEHSLNVYDELIKLCKAHYPDKEVTDEETNEIKVESTCPFSEETLIIVSLLHDISKMNFYEIGTKNVKNDKGVWEQVPFYKTREYSDRFVFGAHGVNSEYITRTFLPLSLEESVAIINHMGGLEAGSYGFDATISEVFRKYPLALLLHTADMLSTYLVEE